MSHPYSGGPTGIETVHERGQGAYNFGLYYENLCALQSSVPLSNVKSCLHKNALQINADKIRSVLFYLRIFSIVSKVKCEYGYFKIDFGLLQWIAKMCTGTILDFQCLPERVSYPFMRNNTYY